MTTTTTNQGHVKEMAGWSWQTCTYGENDMGYTCGLWQLFHVESVGVVEYNRHNNEGTNESDEDLFDSDDGFCSVDDDKSLGILNHL